MSRTSAAAGSQTTGISSIPQVSDVVFKCACGLPAAEFISHTPKNPGRLFYKCPNSNGCGVWQWADELPGSGPPRGPQASPSTQFQAQQPSPAKTPVRRPLTSSTPAKSLRTTQTLSHPPQPTASLSKRKRTSSPSPEPTGSSLTNTKRSDSRSKFIFAALGSPAKRVKQEPPSTLSSEDEELWGKVGAESTVFQACLDDELFISSAQKPKERSMLSHDDVEEPDGKGVARKLDFTRMGAVTPVRRPIVDEDPANPFLATPLAMKPDFPTPITEPLAMISQLEDFLPHLVTLLPELRRQISTLERKKTAETRSAEAKLRRIKTLEEEVEHQREEIKWLKEENAKLTGD